MDTILNIATAQVVHLDAADSKMATILGVLLVIFFIFSFAVSGSQVAFFSFGIKDINLIKTKSQPSYKRILDLLERPQELLFALQIAGWFLYLAIIFTSSYLIDHLLIIDVGFWGMLLLKTVLIFIVIFLFAECLPRAYAAQENVRFAKDFGVLTEIVYYLFKRMGAWLLVTTNSLESAMFKRDTGSYYNVELDNAISLTQRDASEEEKRILQGVLKFNKITVKQVMKSRLDVSGIDYDLNFAQVLKRLRETKYTRLPVYEKTMDKMVGIINIKDFLPLINESDNYDWHKLIGAVYFVHEQKMAGELLEEFQEKHLRFAVVVDEFGGTSGVVTLQDIQEEIIGEIKDERDIENETYKKIDDYNYVFDGKVMINDVCRIIGIPSDTFDVVKGDSDSLAGLVLELAGEIPQVGQVINCGDFNFSVEEINKNRLQKIRVIIDMEE
ncbi:MAG TPA: transporter associated domain-containing protein [Arachidicoccus sp.]